MRVTIKAKTYRGKDGWLVYRQGYGHSRSWTSHIWTESREKADKIKAVLKTGMGPGLEQSTRIDEILREGEGEHDGEL